ncbi:hypothetical protein NDU88_003547 [Pleurodeles waltl]|uniref:Uncharacterized protein n=1 Tax=Pleurodeles waltl TaxID=8319 RepID=A0AAV7L246_PLEWA|nr:hypothetical protein NDU88_003547 [Pleurodeles waltl]
MDIKTATQVAEMQSPTMSFIKIELMESLHAFKPKLRDVLKVDIEKSLAELRTDLCPELQELRSDVDLVGQRLLDVEAKEE